MVRKRKSQANIIAFISTVDKNCQINQALLIEKAKLCGAFSNVDWDDSSWDVTPAYAHCKRGSKANRPNDFIHFTRHAPKAKKIGDPLEEPLADIVKALVALRYFYRGQSLSSHMTFIRACRYVRDALQPKEFDITHITPHIFDEASKAVMKREKETTAYKVIGHLEELAGLIDSNRLAKLRLDWRCKLKKRPASLSPDRIEDAAFTKPDTDRLPPEEAIMALAKLYTGESLPKNLAMDDPRMGDRILLLIVVLLACTGLRIGEVLTLRAMGVRTGHDGSKFLEYYVQKVSPGNVTIEVRQKILMTETEELVIEVMNELIQKTQAARDVAKYIFDHGEVLIPLSDNPVLTKQEIFDAVGINDNLSQFLRARKVAYEVERLFGFEGRGANKRILVKRDDLLAGLLRDHWTKPVLPGDRATRLELHDALCVAFPFQFHNKAVTLKYAAQPIHDGNIRDFLMGRESTKHWRGSGGMAKEMVYKVQSVFEKYNITDEDGETYGLRSHGFRHFLNHLLDEGGLPDLLQAKWFGRKNVADTKAYQHMTPAQRASMLHREILAGNADGYVPKIIKVIPVGNQQAFLEARIRAVHDVGTGICIHDFAQLPCEKHLQCTGDCHDYVWIKNDEDRIEELKRQAAMAWMAHETVKREISGANVYVENDWLTHSENKLVRLRAQLASAGLEDIILGDLAQKYMESNLEDANA